MLRPLIITSVALILGACQPTATANEPQTNPTPEEEQTTSTPAEETATTPPTCVVTACMAGAMTRKDGANPWFNEICAGFPDIIESCDTDGTCYAMFNAFDVDGTLNAILEAQDANKDGVLTADDPVCTVNLVGYSWGGVNTLEVTRRVASDERFDATHKNIARLLVIDAYAPTAGGRLDVPDNALLFRSWRQSVPPPRDCSRRAPLGPYRGLPMVCDDPERCVEFDFSLEPQSAFPGGYQGDEIGHCRVVRTAAHYIRAELGIGEAPTQAAPRVP